MKHSYLIGDHKKYKITKYTTICQKVQKLMILSQIHVLWGPGLAKGRCPGPNAPLQWPAHTSLPSLSFLLPLWLHLHGAAAGRGATLTVAAQPYGTGHARWIDETKVASCASLDLTGPNLILLQGLPDLPQNMRQSTSTLLINNTLAVFSVFWLSSQFIMLSGKRQVILQVQTCSPCCFLTGRKATAASLLDTLLDTVRLQVQVQ